ncbi:MAG: cytochrome c peroxidase [Candidatus Binatia bacterium]
MNGKRLRRLGVVGAAWLCAVGGCGGGDAGGGEPRQEIAQLGTPNREGAQLGEQIFDDTSLSEPPGLACASCHDEAHGFADPSGGAVSAGGAAGFRNSPSLAYAMFTPPFSAQSTVGGLNRDGRATDFVDQAVRPLLNPAEMANPDVVTLMTKVAATPYAQEFRRIFGADVFNDPDRAFEHLREALSAYEQTDEFQRFDSKFDFVRRGEAQFTQQERLGFDLFNDPEKGNCAACHPASGSRPLFTDFTYDNLGVPRNRAIPANRDPAFFDLGLCGPARTDLADSTLCGAFKVPTLRNVAITAPYFHNGQFQTLRELVDFYVTRDTNPERWYPGGNKFDDLSPLYRGNVNTGEVPYDRNPGEAPRLNEDEIDAVVAFLGTLTDGYGGAP